MVSLTKAHALHCQFICFPTYTNENFMRLIIAMDIFKICQHDNKHNGQAYYAMIMQANWAKIKLIHPI